MIFRLGTGVLTKDAQESEDNKSFIICDNIFSQTTIIGQLLLYLNIHPRPQQEHEQRAYGIELLAVAAANKINKIR